MQINRPSHRHCRVRIFSPKVDVPLRQYDIAQQAARFPFSEDESHPIQLPVAERGGAGGPVLQIRPVGINGHQFEIPDPLGIQYHILVETGFPRPFSGRIPADIPFVERKAEFKLRERDGILRHAGIPLDGSAQDQAVRMRRSRFLPVPVR